jgi:hypothetical protein
LWGAARVEDTYNLIGHALRKALGVIARQEGWDLMILAAEAGAEFVTGSSLKAALDLNWDEPAERQRALGMVLAALASLEGWIDQHPAIPHDDALTASLAAAQQVRAQDVELDAASEPSLREGVAKDRRIAIEDAEMRHGRKSRSQRVDGFKRHFVRDLDRKMIRAVGLTGVPSGPTSPRPPSPMPSWRIWLVRRSSWPNCTSIGRTWPATWCGTGPRT